MKNKKRKIDRKHLIHTFIFFVFCVFGLTVAYAALSTTLNISGSAEVTSSEWNIVFEPMSLDEILGTNVDVVCLENGNTCGDNYMLSGNAVIEQFPTITNTTIKDFSLSVSLPGDTVIFVYSVTNKGSIPAKLSSSKTTSGGMEGASNDILWFDENGVFIHALRYDDITGETISNGDVICPGETKLVLIYFGIVDDATTLPSGPIKFINRSVEYNFIQADTNSCLS